MGSQSRSGRTVRQLWLHAGFAAFSAAFFVFGTTNVQDGRASGRLTLDDPAFFFGTAVLLFAGILCFAALFQFPWRVKITEDGLEVAYLHRRKSVPHSRIRAIEHRGHPGHHNTWVVYTNGREEALGVWSRRLAMAWDDLHSRNSRS